MLQRCAQAARLERAADAAERLRIAEAQASERARVEASIADARRCSEALVAQRTRVVERQHALERARSRNQITKYCMRFASYVISLTTEQ